MYVFRDLTDLSYQHRALFADRPHPVIHAVEKIQRL